MESTLEKLFKFKAAGTDLRTETLAGLTTFMTMAYILAVNPSILKISGMDPTAVMIATAISACLGTLLMAFLSNYPFAQAPAMGLNAFFAFTVCGQMGYDWRVALLAVFVEGLIFILLTLTNVREAIFNAIPINIKLSVSAGIGLFIAFIGLKNACVIVDNPATFVSLQAFRSNIHTAGIAAILCLIGVILIGVMMKKNVMGAMLIGVLATWILGMGCEAAGIYIPDPKAGFYSTFPRQLISFDFSPLGNTLGQCFSADMSSIHILEFMVIVASFLFVDLFDTLGTVIGVASKAGFLDEDGHLPRVSNVLLSDAVATTAGAVLGTSTVSTYVESAAGVSSGGRTGMTSLVTAGMFVLSMVFAPLFLSIPAFAVAPALIVTGFLMMQVITHIEFIDFTEGLPSFLCLLFMPLCYSIADGIAVGIISWVFINVLAGNQKEKKINALLYLITAFLLSKYIFM